MSDGDTTPMYVSTDGTERREPLVAGIQHCRACGARQLCVWPAAGDTTDAFECSACGELAAAFIVGHAIEMFPDIATHVRSRRAWMALEPKAPTRES